MVLLQLLAVHIQHTASLSFLACFQNYHQCQTDLNQALILLGLILVQTVCLQMVISRQRVNTACPLPLTRNC